jgi:hypothetical protein
MTSCEKVVHMWMMSGKEEIFVYCRLYHKHWNVWKTMFCVTCWTVTGWIHHDWNIVLTEVHCTIKLKLFYWRNSCLKSNMILYLTLDVLCEILVRFLKKLWYWWESSSSGGSDKVTWYWLVLLWFILFILIPWSPFTGIIHGYRKVREWELGSVKPSHSLHR